MTVSRSSWTRPAAGGDTSVQIELEKAESDRSRIRCRLGHPNFTTMIQESLHPKATRTTQTLRVTFASFSRLFNGLAGHSRS